MKHEDIIESELNNYQLECFNEEVIFCTIIELLFIVFLFITI